MIRIYAHLLAFVLSTGVLAVVGSFPSLTDWHEVPAASGLVKATDQPKSTTEARAAWAGNKPLLALPAQINPISPISPGPLSQPAHASETALIPEKGEHESAANQLPSESFPAEDTFLENREPAEKDEPVLAPLLAIPSGIVTLQKAPSPTERGNEAEPAPLPAIMSQAKLSHAPNQTSPPVRDTEKQPPTSKMVEPALPQPTVGTANRVTVQSVGIDVSVQQGGYDTDTGVWEVDESSAFHADTTVPVNDSNGTTLIYGHAKWGIFASLPSVSEGAEAIVFTQEGLRFVYEFESVAEVSPEDVGVLTAEGQPKLILQTCSGWFDQYRTLVTFRFKEVLKA